MAEFVEKGWNFWMSGGLVGILKHPAEEYFKFSAGGI